MNNTQQHDASNPETLTGNLFNRIHPNWDFAGLIRDRMGSGQWTEQELALTIKNQWLAGLDARYDDVLRDIRKVLEEAL